MTVIERHTHGLVIDKHSWILRVFGVGIPPQDIRRHVVWLMPAEDCWKVEMPTTIQLANWQYDILAPMISEHRPLYMVRPNNTVAELKRIGPDLACTERRDLDPMKLLEG